MKIEIVVYYRLRCVSCTYVSNHLEKEDFLASLSSHLDDNILHNIEVTTMVRRA